MTKPIQKKQEDLYRTSIPGGTATFFRAKELSSRREEELAIAGTPAEGAINKIREARKVVGPNGESDTSRTLTGIDVHLTRDEARDILYLNNTLAWVLLKSWSLKETYKEVNGEESRTVQRPKPLPESVDDLHDLPKELKNALVKHAAKLWAAEEDAPAKDSFSIDPGIEDKNSPTGA